MMSPLPRVVVAALTPCEAPGLPSLEGMTRLARHVTSEGCDGMFILGSSGEASLLGEEVRRKVTRAARAGAGERTIFCGISGLGVAHSLRLAKNAAEDGADVVVAMAPYFLKLSQAQLLEYAWRIANESPLPVAFYHHLRMPTAFEPETIAALASHENIVALKETSGSLERLWEIVKTVKDPDFAVYQGSEALVLDSLAGGAYGSMTAMANGVPALFRELTDAWLAGNEFQAQELQRHLLARARIFQQPEIGRSFAHFLQAIGQPLWRKGVLSGDSCMSSRFEPAFFRWVGDFYAECELPVTSEKFGA